MFNERLRCLLKSRAISGKMLAEKLSVTPVKVSRWLTGKNCPGYDELNRLCDFLHVSADFLVCGRQGHSQMSLVDQKIINLPEAKKEMIVSLLSL